MTTRFDVERAVLASELPSRSRLLMFVLLAHADNDSAIIPARFTPSLTVLATESGLARSTVKDILNDLESAGWVVRQRPSVEQSRKGVRTQYRMTVPVDARDNHPGPDTGLGVGRTSAQVGRAPAQAGSDSGLAVGRTPTPPRPDTGPMSTHPLSSTRSTQRAGARGSDGSRNGKTPAGWMTTAVDFVSDRLTATTGRTYDRRDVGESVTAFLRCKTVTNPLAYIRKCADENPLQFEPTPSPPRYIRNVAGEVAR